MFFIKIEVFDTSKRGIKSDAIRVRATILTSQFDMSQGDFHLPHVRQYIIT